MTNPAPQGFTRQVGQAWSCDICGALVDDTVIHTVWHRKGQ